MARQLTVVAGVFLSMVTMVRCIDDTTEDQRRACVRDIETIWLIETTGHEFRGGEYRWIRELDADGLADLQREVCR
ncbi:MAG: hypothetical protein R2749_29745 [Acidimicrobiales bacterium]